MSMIIHKVTDGMNDYGFFKHREVAEAKAEEMRKYCDGEVRVSVIIMNTAEPGEKPKREHIPKCVCGTHMVKRRGKYGEFWGCINYPACRHTASVPGSLPALFEEDDYDDWAYDAFSDITGG